jgi:hypothetical protein
MTSPEQADERKAFEAWIQAPVCADEDPGAWLAGYATEAAWQAWKARALQAQALAPRQIPPPKMTIAGEGPDRGHWWSEDQVRAIVSGETRSGASDGSEPNEQNGREQNVSAEGIEEASKP